MMDENRLTYPPLNTLKRVADDVWIVDGPVIKFGLPWPKLSFPTRMTILRVEGGDLLLHSPTALDSALKDQVEQIGRPRWIIGPNRIHYWWIPDWHAAFPEAQVFLAPRIREQAAGRITFDCATLDRETGYPWDKHIATLPIASRYMTEVEFFHRASRTLVLTDLIENFERDKLESWTMRVLTRVGGVQEPGSMPRDMRLTFRGRRQQLKAAVQTMIEWNPERIILAHGRWYASNGQAEIAQSVRLDPELNQAATFRICRATSCPRLPRSRSPASDRASTAGRSPRSARRRRS